MTQEIRDFSYFNHIWSVILNDLQTRYGEATYNSWLSKLNLSSFNYDNIVLTVPTQFIRDWVSSHYLETILNLWAYYDPQVKNVSILVAISAPVSNASSTIIDSSQTQNDNVKKYTVNYIDEEGENNIFSYNLEPRFTFDNFVVGPPNELAYAAARAVAESTNVITESNPLFLYGGVGLGKTHLMHSIALYIKNTNPTRKVIYMSAEKFMYQFVRALRNKDIMSFKEQFRSVDVLMIDDIQFICGKDSTQEEFFHTFNALIDSNRQMVISCDRSPSDLDNIEDRIKSRLGWGLVADVHSTTYELRLGILYSKLALMNVEVPKNVIEFLAAKITSNVRELEGALNKVIAHSTLVGREINLESTQNILRDLLRSNERVITIEEIQRKIAHRYDIKIADMSSSERSRNVARPRQIAMYLSKQLTSKSLAEIGKKFGKKDHTTIIHAIKKVEELSLQDAEFSEELNLLTKILQN